MYHLPVHDHGELPFCLSGRQLSYSLASRRAIAILLESPCAKRGLSNDSPKRVRYTASRGSVITALRAVATSLEMLELRMLISKCKRDKNKKLTPTMMGFTIVYYSCSVTRSASQFPFQHHRICSYLNKCVERYWPNLHQ